MGYFRHAAKGMSWVVGLKAFTRVISFGRTIILARLLLPSQFGVYGIAALILALLEIFTETGINVFLIQEEKSLDEYVDTAWLLSILRGCLMAVLIFLFSPLIAGFFATPQALPLLHLVSLVPLIKGFINPAVIRFYKHLEFHKDFWLRTVIYIADAGVAILLTWITRSPASLIWGLVAGGMVEVVWSHLFISPHPRFDFNPSIFKKIISQGKWVTATGIFTYLAKQGADIAIAKTISATALGVYQMGYRVSASAITEIGDTTGKVTFPVFVFIAGDRSRLKKAWLKTTLVIAAAVIPATLAIMLFPQIIIKLILGDQWLEAVPFLPILAVVGAITALSGPAGAVFLSLKRQDISMKITLIKFIALALTIMPLIYRFGTLGTAASVLISVTLTIPVIYYYLVKVAFSPASQ